MAIKLLLDVLNRYKKVLVLENEIINRISKVSPDSIGSELDIEVGDRLLNINGHPVKDIIEYRYYIADEYLEMDIEKCNGEIWTLEIEKDFDEDLGLEFENPIIDQSKNCQNQCIFCFIDQLPENMRSTLYFKDDDSRLSFLQGNYITLTNMKEGDIQRIIDYRISPINLSVHATDPELRIRMLNNKKAGSILAVMKRFDKHQIKMNCQIVLCPGVNDGVNLDQTIEDLKDLENIQSTAIVPVGISKFREGLFSMKPYDQRSASKVIDQVEKWQKEIMGEKGRRFVHLSDEFYILANRPLPKVEDYEGFPQIENGVGLMTKFRWEVKAALAQIEVNGLKDSETLKPGKKSIPIQIITGTLAKDFIAEMANEVSKVMPILDIEIIAVKNHFFGETITVSGLVTGKDILETIKSKEAEKENNNFKNTVTIIPNAMLKAEEEVFLDDLTVKDLEEKLNRKVVISSVDGKEFVDKLYEISKST